MEKLIKQIEERIVELQKNPTNINIGKVSELNLVKMRLVKINYTQCCGGKAEQLKVKKVPTFDKYLLKFESKDRYGETMWFTGTGFKTKESMMQIYEDYITNL